MTGTAPDWWIEAEWPAPAGIRAGATLRTGGTSATPFASLNLGTHVGDHLDAVLANRARVVAGLGLPSEPLWLDQRHGARVVRAESGAAAAARADGCVATRSGAVCAVLTADCVPVLIAATDGSCYGALHAGWRGLLAGVIESGLAMIGTPATGLTAWIGPAIGARRYRVDAALRERFARAGREHLDAFTATGDGGWYCDLGRVARQRLARAGVAAVHGGRWCTASDPERFFSYRRDGCTGRGAALVWRER